MLKKKLFKFAILTATILSSKAAFAVYWNELSEEKRNVVIRFYPTWQDINNKLDEISDVGVSAHFLEAEDKSPMIREQDPSQSLPAILHNKMNELDEICDKAKFEDQTNIYVKNLFQTLNTQLSDLLIPIQDQHDKIRSKPNLIKADDPDVLLLTQSIIIAKMAVRKLFPESINAAKRLIFLDFEGDKKPLPPEFQEAIRSARQGFEKIALQVGDPSESVMEVKKIFQTHYPTLKSCLPLLIQIPELKEIDKASFFAWKDQLLEKGIIELKTELERRAVVIAIANAEPFNSELTMYDDLVKGGVKPGEMWGLTYHLVRKLYEQDPTNADRKNLVSLLFLKLVEQDNQCTPGGMGRMFQVLTEAGAFLAEKYNQ